MPDAFGNLTFEDLLAMGGGPPPEPGIRGGLPPTMALGGPPEMVQQPAAQLPDTSGGWQGALQNMGLAFAQNPLQYQPRGRGHGGEDFFGALLAGLGNSFGQGTARNVASREAFNERQRAAAAARNAANLAATQKAQDRANEMADFAKKERIKANEGIREKNATAGPTETPEQKQARIKAEHKAMAEGNAEAQNQEDELPMSEAAKRTAARRYLVTGLLPSMGMGKAARRDRKDIMDMAASMDPEANIAANAADYRANAGSQAQLQRMTDNATAFASTAHKNAQLVMKAMAKIKDAGSPVLNRPIRAIDTSLLGREEMAAYNVARQTVIPEFARLLNNPNMTGELSDTARREIDSIARGDYTLKQMKAALDQFEADAANRTASYRDQLETIRSRTRNIGGNGPPVVRWGRDANGNPVRIQ